MAIREVGQDLESAYQDGVRDERDRIARDLHDGIIHSLFGIGLSLQTAAAEVADERLHRRLLDAINALDEAIRDLREHLFQSG